MNETLKRGLSGAVYVAIMWLGTSYSELSFHILFSVILVICLYEMWKLRKGKTKILAFIYVLTPLLLVHLYSQKIILFIFILTWTFDTFAYLFGVKFGKTKIMPSISPKKSWEGFAGGFIFTIIVTFTLINIGFLAQEVKAIETNLGIDNHAIVDTTDLDSIGMKYSKLIPVLVKAIQELSAENEALKVRLTNGGL